MEWNAGPLEGGFKPCPFLEVQKMMGSLQHDGHVFPFRDDAPETLRRLVDASLVVLDLADDNTMTFVYPAVSLKLGCCTWTTTTLALLLPLSPRRSSRSLGRSNRAQLPAGSVPLLMSLSFSRRTESERLERPC